MEKQMYEFTGNGLVPLAERAALPVGLRVWSFGAGMSESAGCIISGPDEHGAQEYVTISDWPDNRRFGKVGRHAKPISKKFGIGVYWSDDLADLVPEAEMKEAVKLAEEATEARKEAARLAEESDKAERAALPGLYPWLVAGGEGIDNIRAMVRHEWPGVKFSVRQERRGTVYVRWTDGPAEREVDKKMHGFEDHHHDWSGDYWDYSPSNFNRVFGGVKFVFCRREISAEAEAVFDAWAAGLWAQLRPNGGELWGCRDAEHMAAEMCRRSEVWPKFRIEKIEGATGNEVTCFYRTVNDGPELPVIRAEGGHVSFNEVKNGVEVRFPSRPSAEVLARLKGAGFRWSKFSGCWWSKRTAAAVAVAQEVAGGKVAGGVVDPAAGMIQAQEEAYFDSFAQREYGGERG